jgi:hypothetical protein
MINGEQELVFESKHKPTYLARRASQVYEAHRLNLSDCLSLKGPHSRQMQFIVDCINSNLPLLIVSNDTQKLASNLQTLAQLAGNPLSRILLNEKSDTS